MLAAGLSGNGDASVGGGTLAVAGKVVVAAGQESSATLEVAGSENDGGGGGGGAAAIAAFDAPVRPGLLIGEGGENMITIVAGANDRLTEADIDETIAAMSAGDVLMLQFEIPAGLVEHALHLARGQGVRTVLNIAPATADAIRLAALADSLIANESEFELLVARKLVSPEEQRGALLALHAESRQTIVVTLGSRGAMAAADGKLLHTDGLVISPVDTVGAGDTFCGYLCAGQERGGDLEKALNYAALAGSLACLRPGAQAGIPRRDDVISWSALLA